MLRSQKSSVYRFNHQLPPDLPLAVRSAGTYSLVPDSKIEPPVKKWFSEIFWSEEGCGEFELEKQPLRVKDCEIFYLLPGEIHAIRPLSPHWKYHWLTLDHPQSPQWLKAFGFTERPLPSRICPTDLFQKLMGLIEKGTAEDDRKASHCAHAILLAAKEGSLSAFSEARSSWVEQCRLRIDKEYADPQLNVSEIAREMKVHRATLFRAFVQAYQMTPSHYLQNRRLHHAIELLKQTDLPIKEVSQKVGMANANYLARSLRKISGIPPLKFRARYRQERMDHS